MPGPCSSCELRETDWGGAPARALAPAGDAALADPVGDKSPEHQRIVESATAEAPDFRYRRIGAED